MKAKLEGMYLEWTNNFLTVAGYAEYYGLNEEQAGRIINIGRKINNKGV